MAVPARPQGMGTWQTYSAQTGTDLCVCTRVPAHMSFHALSTEGAWQR